MDIIGAGGRWEAAAGKEQEEREEEEGEEEEELESMEAVEEQVVKLMGESMGSALQFLQGKGLCLMPIALTATLSLPNALPSSAMSDVVVSDAALSGIASATAVSGTAALSGMALSGMALSGNAVSGTVLSSMALPGTALSGNAPYRPLVPTIFSDDVASCLDGAGSTGP